MDQYDELLHQRAAEESFPLPEDYAGRVFQTCAALDENSRRRQRRHWETWVAAALALFITIPNVSPSAAAAMAEIPGLGALVKVVTFRSYAYNDGHSSMDISVPELSGSDAADTVNQEVRAYTDELLTQFYKDCEHRKWLSGSACIQRGAYQHGHMVYPSHRRHTNGSQQLCLQPLLSH